MQKALSLELTVDLLEFRFSICQQGPGEETLLVITGYHKKTRDSLFKVCEKNKYHMHFVV